MAGCALNIILLTFLVSYCAGERLRYDVPLDHSKRMHLYWDFNYESQIIDFLLEVKMSPNEFFGFGFSDYGEATEADLVLFWADLHGKYHFQDGWTDQRGLFHKDDRQSYRLIDAKYSHGTLLVAFSRKFDTCDDRDYQIDRGTTHIVFFLGKGKLWTTKGLNVTSFKPGLQRAQLLKSEVPIPEYPQDTKTFEMRVSNVHVPADETTYWCKTKLLPEMPTKHHIIQFEGVISEGSENLVHHIEVFHCEVGEGEKVPYYDAPCSSEKKPKRLEVCKKVIGAWAMGATAFPLPEEAGYPIGGKGFSRYVMMEVHYNNPQKVAGKIDSSGIKFTYTSTLRKFDAGVMELGLEYTNKMALSPRQKIFELSGYCIPECTAVGLPEKGIKIFGSQLHTHLTGKRVVTRHVRDMVELPNLNKDDHYSPHFQEIRLLPKPVHIMPGDALITTCFDTTLDKPNATIGGFAISDEMCVNYVHYYPKSELEVCKSSIETKTLDTFFKVMHESLGDATSREKGDRENYNSIAWDPLRASLLNKLYAEAPLSMQCNQSDGNKFPRPGGWDDTPLPLVLLPLEPERRHCDKIYP